MERTLNKKAFPEWAKRLSRRKIYWPKKDDEGRWDYTEGLDDLTLDVLQTALPPKKILFPQREVFLEFFKTAEGNRETLEVKEILPEEESVVIFGARPCEARAAWLLDEVFSGDYKDPYYWRRRDQTSLVGLTCSTPLSENCFCLSVGGSPFSEEGLDIALTDLGEVYYVKSLTPKGDALINAAKELFEEPKAEEKKKLKAIQAEAEKKIKRRLKAPQGLSAKLKGMFESPLWDEESMACIRCGICTYLCPSCHCFDLSDEVDSSSPLRGKRVRTWDTCQFPDFTMHSSGHNPRPDRASRLRQRLFHKFQYFVEVYDKFQCVGCGRCITLCPMGIDIIKVLDKVSDHGA
ncbi:MAG: 4Fe-4S dicluster domain-containing protein [Acidobacteriota bacterium]